MADTEVKTPEFKDPMQKAAYDMLEQLVKERNDLVGKANLAHGDRVTLTEQITEESTDKAIVKAREKRDDAIIELHNLVTPIVDAMLADVEGSVKEIEEQLKEVDGKLKPGVTFYRKIYGDEAAQALPQQARLKGLRISGGGGGRRIRGFRFVVTDGSETQEFENAAGAAKYLDVETNVLQEAFFTAAGNPKQVKDAPDEVDFDIEITETDEEGNTETKTVKVNAFRPDAGDSEESSE